MHSGPDWLTKAETTDLLAAVAREGLGRTPDVMALVTLVDVRPCKKKTPLERRVFLMKADDVSPDSEVAPRGFEPLSPP